MADEPEVSFESVEGLDPEAPKPPKPSEELFRPSEHTELRDPALCRALAWVSLALSVLGVCLPSCLAVPMILAGGLLAGIAWAWRERRLSHIALAVALGALLLHGFVRVGRGLFSSFHKGVIGGYERELRE